MFSEINLRKLTEMTASDRCFLSLYFNHTTDWTDIEKQCDALSRALNISDEAEKDERNHLNENLNLVRQHLDQHPLKEGAIAVFACWMLDYLQVVPIPAGVDDLVWIDSSPCIRPLAELQEEYENVVVVVADNKRARIFTVSSAVAGDASSVHGNVKNHVKKGGWSQQRYERRRDKQLMVYSREINAMVQTLCTGETISHVVLLGGKEIIQEIMNNLPESIRKITGFKVMDLGKGDAAIRDEMFELMQSLERETELDLWERIRREYLRGGLGTVGLQAVHSAAAEGKVDTMIVARDFKPVGCRCRQCQSLFMEPLTQCTQCGSESLFTIDAVEELVETVELQGGVTDFVDAPQSLVECGSIGALLRFK